MPAAPLIEQSFLEKLERLTLQWQRSFPGLVGGHNASRFPGAGQEFLDHRHFHHGDDLRAVNWRAYLRLEKLFLKMFQVEPRIPVRMLIDASSSMKTGTPVKFEYVQRLAAALCYIGLVRLDMICLQPFRDGLLDSFLCGGGRHRFVGAVNFLSELEASGRTDFLQVARQFAGGYSQRGLLIVLSDFLDDRDAEKPLQFLADQGHELLLVQVWASEDREPGWEGELELTDAETGDRMEIALDEQARLDYTAAFDEYTGRLQRMCQRTGGRHIGLPVTASLEEAIFGPLVRSGGVQ
ncbi:MAG: DUF58 domain-containing protein [Acidobacteria bacterium]|nr:DUF58 domain-containing protein [Acidobacteriota bacterium]MBI3278630.1 DUF58 domain-containing protein [Acidobacteriota bacterium]